MNKKLFDDFIKQAEDLKAKRYNPTYIRVSKKKVYLFLLSELFLSRNIKDLKRVAKLVYSILVKKEFK